jgi:hypothetical protein
MADNVKKYDNHKRQFDENQYEMLIRCSEKQDITKWNQWRGNKKEVSILLNTDFRATKLLVILLTSQRHF